MKKAYELSVLCDCEIALIIFTSNNKLYQYASSDMDKVLLKYTEYNDTVVSQTNKDIVELLNKKENKGTDLDGEDEDFPLTPRTEESYRRIDEQYARAMQQSSVKSLTPFQNAVPVTVPTQYSQAQVPVTGAGSNTVVLLQPPPSTANSSSTSPNTTGSHISSMSSRASPQPQGTMTSRTSPVPVALHEAMPISTSSKKPGLKVLIPDRGGGGIINASRGAVSTALETPAVSIATPTQQAAPNSQLQNAVLTAGDFQLGSADLAGLSPLVYQWSAQGGQGPLTAAVCAAGLTFTPSGSLSFSTSAGAMPILSVAPQAVKGVTQGVVKTEPVSPNHEINSTGATTVSTVTTSLEASSSGRCHGSSSPQSPEYDEDEEDEDEEEDEPQEKRLKLRSDD
ncbi:hypothetical protein C0Q70_20195 [Pomacea canaliculata]|uniref:MADS-box domain-containing protein n=2 Tax=Pomacea canaliculata TaxID=400727 RepID=A0A2T7NEW0_POMCA|nr:hypothetical protein C0Q70_20195 [Pomacea canaliculata]